MQIAEGIYRIDTELGARVNSLYLFRGEDACLLFDVGVDGTAQRFLAPAFEDLTLAPHDLTWAAISHADVDHFGGLTSLREFAPQVTVLAHRSDAAMISDYASFEKGRARGFRDPWGLDEDPAVLAWTRSVAREGPIDLEVSGGERLRLQDGWAVEILHAPGHSRGHLAIWDPRSRALAVSDAVLSDAVRLANGDPAFPPTYRFVNDYLSTIRYFEALEPAHLLTAHYPSMEAEAGLAFLAASRNFAATLEEVMLESVAARGDRGMTLQELLVELNPKVGAWPEEGTHVALAFPVVGHLERALAVGSLEAIEVEGTKRVRIRS